ncbi:hypothetical protein INT45_004274 [Circinella minor]|uniref:Uncharacterized protein n=1 Tax=Circinella minor TaxID=1195481 RepID=A0A8H7VU97_9FUNG|nr:hypothetical protein INT45_004274 [Circinella minor]
MKENNDNNDNVDENGDEKESKQEQRQRQNNKKDDLSFLHYILAMPLATIYIVIRAMLDCIRNVIFWTLWFLEKSAPVIDAWLFDKVTVWLPKKYEQCETWWSTRGVHVWRSTQDYAVHTAIPTTVYCIDQSFIGIAHIYRRVHKISIQFGGAWQRFAKQHDWKQLMHDMADVWFAIVWQPAVWTITRIYRLVSMIYYGGRNVLRSIKQDLQWLFTLAIPTLWQVITNTQVYHWISRGISWFSIHFKRIIAKVLQQFVLPLLKNIRCNVIISIDFIASIVESHGFQTRLQKIRTFILSNMIWWIEEQVVFFTDNIDFLLRVAIPCVTYFTNELLPALTEAYKHLATAFWNCYIYYVRPVIIETYYFIQPSVIVVYKYVSGILFLPFISFWKLIQLVGSTVWDTIQHYGQHTVMASLLFIQQSATHTWLLSKKCYASLTLWFEKQAPYIMNTFSKSWELAVTNGLALSQVDTIGMRDWIVKVSEMTFESLERTLSEWIKEQSQPTNSTTNNSYDDHNEKKTK